MGIVDLAGKRVLLTQSEDFMGPVLREVFAEAGFFCSSPASITSV